MMVRRVFSIEQNRVRLRRWLKVKSVDYGGLRVCTDPDYVGKGILKALYTGRYEREEFHLVRKYLKPTDRTLEVGAGLGIMSSLCASICGSEAVVSYEANSSLKKAILKNYELNNVSPELRIKALAESEGETVFHFHHNFYSSSLVERENSVAETVQCDAINAVIAEHKATAIVMDVEGAEIDLLPIADLTDIQTLIVETHPHIVGEEKTAKLIGHLEECGFKLHEAPGGVIAMTR